MNILPVLLSGLTAATPLILCAMGETLGEKAGVINIGIEGEMLGGAFAAYALSSLTGSALYGCTAAAAAGMLLAALFSLVSISGRSDPIVTGTAINLLALGTTGLFFRRFFLTGAFGRTALLGRVLGGLTVLDLLALALIPASFVFLFRTTWGLRLRAAGESRRDSAAFGIHTQRTQWAATLTAGALCGLAGASLTLELSNTFVEGMSSGRGFVALALVAFGRWNPVGVAAACLFFGLIQAAQFQLQARGLFHLPSQALLLLPYILSLLALAGYAGKTKAPGDLGKVTDQ